MNFTPPDKEKRLKAIGNLDEIPDSIRIIFKEDKSFKAVPVPSPGDWLYEHPESGQTYEDFINSNPNKPDSKRNKIYLQPLGSFPRGGSPPMDKLKEYVSSFFLIKVEILPSFDIEDAKLTTRINPYTKRQQILTTDILNLLKENLPVDAFCLMAITMEDLYPHPTWNFVFGQASLRERVGVYSFARYDFAFYGEERGKDYKKLILWRSCKVLVHEICHQFGIEHCIYYHCVMNGSNHLEESDARPQHLCPIDLRKLYYSIGFDPVERYNKLLNFYEECGFEKEAKWVKERLKEVLKSE
jgi:archaemetzincin